MLLELKGYLIKGLISFLQDFGHRADLLRDLRTQSLKLLGYMECRLWGW